MLQQSPILASTGAEHPPRSSYATSAATTQLLARMVQVSGLPLEHVPSERWIEWQGHQVHVDMWSPARLVSMATVIVVHGAGGNGRILAPFADRLAAAGIASVAPDLPGYGLTMLAPGWRPDYRAWPELVAELARRVVRQTQRPVVLLGLSMGGVTAAFAAQLAPEAIAGVVATNLLDMGDAETFCAAARYRWLGRIALTLYRRWPALADRIPAKVRNVAPFDRLSRDPQLNQLFAADPLIGARWISGRWFRTTHAYVPPEASWTLPCPLLLVHPGADRWTPLELSLRTFDRIASSKRCVVLDGGGHLPLEPGPFETLLRETVDFVHNPHHWPTASATRSARPRRTGM